MRADSMPPGLNALAGLAVVVAVLYWLHVRGRPRLDLTSHGTSKWASSEQLDPLATPGLVLGRDRDGRLLSLPKKVPHHLIVAPTGAGKGVSFIIPWLLTHRGSVLVIDPKGENYQITHRTRRRYGKVYKLDPYGVCPGATDCWNPLDEVPDGEAGLSEAQALAESMVLRPPQGDSEPHWNNRACQLLKALIALVARLCPPGERHLGSVRDLLSRGCDGALLKLKEVAQKLEERGDRQAGALYARMAGALSGMESKEKSGVVSTADAHSTFLDTPEMSYLTSVSTFQLEELVGPVPTTLYLILPPHQMNEANARWLRMIVGCLIRMLSQKGGKHELLMVLDEAGQLGYMPELAMGVTLMRSYKVRMMFFLQSFGQVEELFRQRKSVLTDNTGLIAFGLNDLDSMNRISQMLGNYSHAAASYGANTGTSTSQDDYGHGSRGGSGGESVNYATHQRALLTPDEVRTLDPRLAIGLFSGFHPILVERVEWFREEYLKNLQRRK